MMKTRIKVIGLIIGLTIVTSGIIYILYSHYINFYPKTGAPAPGQSFPPVGAPAPPEKPAPQGKVATSIPPTVDQILEKLNFGNIAFNTPKTMNLHDTAVIQLMLSLKTSIDNLEQMIKAEGEKKGAQIRISDRIKASLSATDFTITTISPEIQAVSQNDITEWEWEIRPINVGHHYLYLTLSVLLNIDGESTPRVIRTFNETIEVEVVWYQQFGLFLEENWQWLWATLLIPIASWLWKRKKASKPNANQPNS